MASLDPFGRDILSGPSVHKSDLFDRLSVLIAFTSSETTSYKSYVGSPNIEA